LHAASHAKRNFKAVPSLKQLPDGSRRRPVVDVQTFAPVDDQADLAQARQMLRQVRLAKAKPAFQMADAHFTFRQEGFQDFEPNRVPERPKQVSREPAILHLGLPIYSVFAI